MFKKCLVAVAALIASIGFAFAQVDVNKADQAALEGVKGVGPATSKRILEERKKNGNFKDWPDLEKRVKGIGEKSAAKLSQAGLMVNNQSMPNAPASGKAMTKNAKADTKPMTPMTAVVVPNAVAPAVAAGTATSKETKSVKKESNASSAHPMNMKSDEKAMSAAMPAKK
jgi:competence protein ComEA